MKDSGWIVVIAAAALLFSATGLRAGTCGCSDTTLVLNGGYNVYDQSNWQPDGQFVITCNGNATYDVTIGPGSSGNFGQRAMQRIGGDPALNYNIYTDATRQGQVWGGTTTRAYDTASGQTQFFDFMYLDFPLGQDVTYTSAGGYQLYQDVLQVTLNPVGKGGGRPTSCTLTIQTAVNGQCETPEVTLDFGDYDPAAANAGVDHDREAFLKYRCTRGVGATITLGRGSYSSYALTTTRAMKGPGGTYLDYDLFTTGLRSAVWSAVGPINSNSKNSYLGDNPSGVPLYGRIPKAQNALAGSYSDVVTATVNY